MLYFCFFVSIFEFLLNFDVNSDELTSVFLIFLFLTKSFESLFYRASYIITHRHIFYPEMINLISWRNWRTIVALIRFYLKNAFKLDTIWAATAGFPAWTYLLPFLLHFYFKTTTTHTQCSSVYPENGTNTGLESSGSFEVINNVEQQDDEAAANTNGFDGGK